MAEERREERSRNLRKMRVSGRMTATLNALRKRTAAAVGRSLARLDRRQRGGLEAAGPVDLLPRMPSSMRPEEVL